MPADVLWPDGGGCGTGDKCAYKKIVIFMDIRAYYLRKRFWFKDFLNGSPMWKDFKDVLYISNNQPVIGGGRRACYLKSIIEFAKANTVFYGRVAGNELSDFPVINKQTILSRYDDFLVPEYKIPGQKGKVHVQKTSGSTGTPFSVPQDTRCRIRRIATIKVENEKIGFHSFEPMMHLRAVKHYWNDRGDWFYDRKLNIIYADNSNLTDEKIANILHAINQYRVKVVRGYMTTLDTITRYAVEQGINLYSHPTFISVGELLLESLRSRIVEKLKCHVVSQYGNEENGIFGQSAIDAPGDTIYLNRANCYIEILKLDSDVPAVPGELGRVVVTDFTNYALPMIRYDIGDVAKIGEVIQGELFSIQSLSGRKTDLIYTTSRYRIDLFNSIPPDIYNNPGILQWQFIQEGQSEYVLRLCLKEVSVRSNEDKWRKSLKALLGTDASIHIEYTSEIPVLNSGKRKIVIQKYTPPFMRS